MTTLNLQVPAGPLTVQIPDGFILTSSYAENGATITVTAPTYLAASSVSPAPVLDPHNPIAARFAAQHHKREETTVDPAVAESQTRKSNKEATDGIS